MQRHPSPARQIEKIGTGANLLPMAPSKSGMDVPSAPIITVQPPDTGGSKGSSRGGAGKVNAVCAEAWFEPTALAAASDTAIRIRGTPLV